MELKKLITAQLVREPTTFEKLKVYCPIHNSPPPATILSQMNPVHKITLYFL
jgi:hypothetical protein